MKRISARLLFFASAFLVLVVIFTFNTSASTGTTQTASNKKDYVADEILVKFKEGTSANQKGSVHTKLNGKVETTISDLNVQVVKVQKDAVEAASDYSKEGNVEYAEPNYIAHVMDYTPNDPQFGKQWAFQNTGQEFETGWPAGTIGADVKAVPAWGVTQGSKDTCIAVLDTGVDESHPDLKAKFVYPNYKEADFSGTGMKDLYGHGTHTAGLAAAATDNHTGVAGMGFNSCLMVAKVCDNNANCPNSWIAQGIGWAADNNAKVISMSLGGMHGSNALQDAVNYAWNKNIVLVAAAGNSDNASPTYPAYYSHVISVAATDQNDAIASFSSFGKWVDVAAPGVELLSTFPTYQFTLELTHGRTETYGYGSGTSMSTPVVAGIAALVWSAPFSKPVSSNTQVVNQIEKNADQIPGTGKYWIYGRVNAYKAVSNQIF